MKEMHPDTKAMIEAFDFDILPVEGTFYKSTYASSQLTPEGTPAGTAMIGLYSETPFSASCFHRLTTDEVWHVYGGDPFYLILLYPDGHGEKILMGSDVLKGQKIQFVVPAGVWQAGCIVPGGRYALFGCTMAPGFCSTGFEAGIAEELIVQYPDFAQEIKDLSTNGDVRTMPEDYVR